MSHAALLLVMVTLAEELRQVPAVGGLLAVLVLVGGNAIVMVLEGSIAAVQGLRLEYYEFFGKFFPGDSAVCHPGPSASVLTPEPNRRR
jgi:V/A-type H+-transporting ATPase subunit I